MTKEQISNKEESGVSQESIVKEAILQSPVNIRFEFPEREGRELKPGATFKFEVPKEFQNLIVRDVILRHRKNKKYSVDIGPDKYDPHGAYTRVELHDSTHNRWEGWQDPKGYSPDKFAEPRPASDPENENLHDWIATVGKIKTDAVRVTNMGEHPEYSTVQIHGLEIIFFPNVEHTRFKERIYTAGTAFVDLKSDTLLPHYGGGSHTEGKYIGAIALNQSGEALFDLGKDSGPGTKKEHGRLALDVESGKELIQIEIAAGDTEHLKEVSLKTGRHTRLGYAKLWIGIQHTDSEKIDWFIKNANVPPQGIISGGPNIKDSLLRPGDTLIIESKDDTSYIMGWRLTYNDEQRPEN